MKVYYWAADTSGCSYYRCVLPAQGLAQRGHDVFASTEMPDEWRDTADVIVGQRVCLPGPTVRWQALAREGRAKLVLEIDDDLFNIHPSSKKAAAFFAIPEIRDNLAANLRVADVVTVTTEHLAEEMAVYNPTVVVLPNCVPAALLEHTPTRREDVVTIGWGGTETHQIDWSGPDERVARFIAHNPGTEMHVIGGWLPPVLASRLPADRHRVTGWYRSVDALHRGIDFHIGVIPLRDNTFNRSKSSVKFTELAALGIPTVASDVGPYAADMRHEVTGLMVGKPTDWARHLGALVADEALRDAIGKAAKDWAATRTIERNALMWEHAYDGTIAP